MFRFKHIFFIAVLLLAGYFIYNRVMTGGMPQGMGGMPQGMAMPVSVAQVIEREAQEWREFSGRLVAVDQVEIRPRVSGTIESIHFNDGDNVKKGDLLFVIDPRPYEAAFQAAEARAVLAETEMGRAERLLADKAVPQRDFDQRKNALRVARAELTRARLDLEYTRIKAPISGRIGRAEITQGNLVDAGGNAPVLTSIVSSNPIYADFDGDEATYIRFARNGGGKDVSQIPVMMGLSTESGTPHTGRIESFDNRLDTASGTIRIRAVFDNPDGFLVPGLFARIKLGSPGLDKVLLITDRAVGTDQSKKFVFVVGGDNMVQYREVKLGAMVDGLRVVESGLQAGEKIIVNGLQRARPGAPVVPEIVPMDAPDVAPAAAMPQPAAPESPPLDMPPLEGAVPQDSPPSVPEAAKE